MNMQSVIPDSRFLKLSLTSTMALVLAIAVSPMSQARSSSNPNYQRTSKDFATGQSSVVDPSMFSRKLDYREAERLKKEAEEQAKKDKENALIQAKEAQINAYKESKAHAVALNNKAVALGREGRFLEAIDAHEQAVKYDPESSQFRINLSAARCAYGQKKLQAGDALVASSLFRKALSAAPDNAMAKELLNQSLRKLGKDPASAELRVALGEQLMTAGDVEGALYEYQAALQIEENAPTCLAMGDFALRLGQAQTAANWYQQALIKDPDYAPAHRQIGALAYSSKDIALAASSLRRAVILDPEDKIAGQFLVEVWKRQVSVNPSLPENHLGLAGALQLTGDFSGSEAEYRKLEALDPKHPALIPGVNSLRKAVEHAQAQRHQLACKTLFNQGLVKEAMAEISQAVMIEPKNATFQFWLGECLEACGDFQGAHQAYLTCVLMDPEANKEAAVRLRNLQAKVQSGVQSGANYTPVQVAPNLTTGQLPGNNLGQFMPGKAAYEGARDAASVQNTTNNTVATASSNSSSEPSLEETIKKAENTNDHLTAAKLIRQVLATDLQNAALHYRLACNLRDGGELADALSEFRIASALKPAEKQYADELAKSTAMYKQLQMQSQNNQQNDELSMSNTVNSNSTGIGINQVDSDSDALK